eukprot:jgi/Psemu1/38089/gm1.38089_g
MVEGSNCRTVSNYILPDISSKFNETILGPLYDKGTTSNVNFSSLHSIAFNEVRIEVPSPDPIAPNHRHDMIIKTESICLSSTGADKLNENCITQEEANTRDPLAFGGQNFFSLDSP